MLFIAIHFCQLSMAFNIWSRNRWAHSFLYLSIFLGLNLIILCSGNRVMKFQLRNWTTFCPSLQRRREKGNRKKLREICKYCWISYTAYGSKKLMNWMRFVCIYFKPLFHFCLLIFVPSSFPTQFFLQFDWSMLSVLFSSLFHIYIDMFH